MNCNLFGRQGKGKVLAFAPMKQNTGAPGSAAQASTTMTRTMLITSPSFGCESITIFFLQELYPTEMQKCNQDDRKWPNNFEPFGPTLTSRLGYDCDQTNVKSNNSRYKHFLTFRNRERSSRNAQQGEPEHREPEPRMTIWCKIVQQHSTGPGLGMAGEMGVFFCLRQQAKINYKVRKTKN